MKKKILVVDDEAAITRFLKLALERIGTYEVRTENQGLMAFRVAKDFRPDLILLDVNIPDHDGGELSEQFRQDATLGRIPIIFLTGAVSPSEAEWEIPTIRGCPVVAKPVNMEKLIKTIEKYT